MSSRFSEKNKKRYGTVNGDPLKRYAPEEKLRYGQGDQFGRTTVYNIVILFVYYLTFLKNLYNFFKNIFITLFLCLNKSRIFKFEMRFLKTLWWKFHYRFYTVVRPNLSPWPYRNFSSGAYRFNWSTFTVPYRFLFFSEKRDLNR